MQSEKQRDVLSVITEEEEKKRKRKKKKRKKRKKKKKKVEWSFHACADLTAIFKMAPG